MGLLNAACSELVGADEHPPSFSVSRACDNCCKIKAKVRYSLIWSRVPKTVLGRLTCWADVELVVRFQCNGERPVCSVCTANFAHCTWDRPSQKRGPPTGQRIILERKVRNLEAFLGYLWLSSPRAKAEVEASLALNQAPFDEGRVEQSFAKWSETDKRAMWQESKAAAWLETRENAGEDDIKALTVARAKAKDSTEMFPTPTTNRDLDMGSTSGRGSVLPNGHAPVTTCLMSVPSSRPPWEPIPSWSAPVQHPQSATRTSPTSAISPDDGTGRSNALAQLSPPVIPFPQSGAGEVTTADIAVPPTGEARYAPAGDLYGAGGSQRYAGPPSGLYMLRAESRGPRRTEKGKEGSKRRLGSTVSYRVPRAAKMAMTSLRTRIEWRSLRMDRLRETLGRLPRLGRQALQHPCSTVHGGVCTARDGRCACGCVSASRHGAPCPASTCA